LFDFIISFYAGSGIFKIRGTCMGKTVKLILLGVILLIIGFIWSVADWHSPRHWIGVKAITDASVQAEGDCGFLLPAGKYVIVVSSGNEEAKGKIEISYLLEVPSEGIRIEKQKVVDMWFVGSFLQEFVVFKKHRTEGHLKVKVISPTKGKISIGLFTNKFAGM
jgi:hypothetical protein